MGNGNSYSEAIHHDQRRLKRVKGIGDFAYSEGLIKSGKALKVHDKLDPKKLNSFGQMIRESRDGVDRPNSHAVAVVFDGTGSMRKVPQMFLERLPKLMGFLIKEGILADPHLLFGMVNDAKEGDAVPLQISQFEGSNEIDEALSHMVLEPNAGGLSERKESYELAMYFLAEYAAMDCLEKRGKKGYLFLIGDELWRDRVSAREVGQVIGDGLKHNLSTDEVMAKLENKFEVFWITPAGTLHWNREEIVNVVRETFGQRYVRLEKPEEIVECIARIIGKCEGFDEDTVNTKLKRLGVGSDTLARTSKAVVAV